MSKYKLQSNRIGYDMDMKEFRDHHAFDSLVKFLIENGYLKKQPEYSEKLSEPYHLRVQLCGASQGYGESR